MLFRLAKEWAIPDPDQLAKVMTYRQLQRWQDYYQVEPWGCGAEDFRMAFLAWMLEPPKVRRRRKPADYIPQWIPPRRLTAEEYKTKSMALLKRAAAQIQNH